MVILGTRCCSIPIASIPSSSSTPGMMYTIEPSSLYVQYLANDTYSTGETRLETKPFIVGPPSTARNFPPNFDMTHYVPITNNSEYGVINTKTGVNGTLDNGGVITKIVV